MEIPPYLCFGTERGRGCGLLSDIADQYLSTIVSKCMPSAR